MAYGDLLQFFQYRSYKFTGTLTIIKNCTSSVSNKNFFIKELALGLLNEHLHDRSLQRMLPSELRKKLSSKTNCKLWRTTNNNNKKAIFGPAKKTENSAIIVLNTGKMHAVNMAILFAKNVNKMFSFNFITVFHI